MRKTRQRIKSVDSGSPADHSGVLAGEILLAANGEPVFDLIDYEFLTARKTVDLLLEDGTGEKRTVSVRKSEDEPLGLNFDTALMSEMRTCANRCMFCFVDQMPKGLRSSLSVKDDDWRYSFIMGNYVTLTNTGEKEFERILKRKVSPLYVSVHATDPEVRTRMMGNRTAGNLMDRLRLLKENGQYFHAQIVLCPGINDGEVLIRSLNELASLWPAARSVAIVPVGLTAYREGLSPLRSYSADEASELIDVIEPIQTGNLKALGSRFAFLSDEWYLLAGRELPGEEEYEAFDQIENGVGLLRLFEEDFRLALSDREPLAMPKTVYVAGGTACSGYFRDLYRELIPYGITVQCYPVPNRFFGGNVHVAGLVTGSDLIHELSGKELGERLLIPRNMLREKEEVFLDDITLSKLSEILGTEVIPFSDGETFVRIVFGE